MVFKVSIQTKKGKYKKTTYIPDIQTLNQWVPGSNPGGETVKMPRSAAFFIVGCQFGIVSV